mmetsp:Transcript_20678/g.62912  ORF Transcript_20678/g.62912 Transcript_20678/m.62912 type:complete len:556 (-) Transcript_20678:1338-3005(-)
MLTHDIPGPSQGTYVRQARDMEGDDARPTETMLSPSQRHLEWPNKWVYHKAGIACLNSLNLGYDVGSIGGGALLVQDDLGLSDEEVQIFIGAASIMSVFGALLAPALCDKLGRRKTFVTSCCVFISGIALVICSENLGVAILGRVFTGLGIGLGLAIDPLYISEISPPWHRGHLVSLSEISINTGIVAGFLMSLCFYTLPMGINWRIIIGLGIVAPSVLLYFAMFTMPESPRWLIANGRTPEARAILKKAYPPDVNVEKVVSDIEDVIHAEQSGREDGWKPIYKPTPSVKLMLLAGVGLGVMQQISGSEAFIYYSPTILDDAGFTSRGVNFAFMCLIGGVKLGAIGVGAYHVDTTGRRPLLMISTGLMFVFLVSIAFVFPHHNLVGLTIFLICAFMAAFSFGVGPITWLGVSEVFPLHLRAKAMSLCTLGNRVTAAIVANTVLTLSNAMGITGFFLFYSILALFSMWYLFRYFPETRGRTLEEMTAYFERAAIMLQGRTVPPYKSLYSDPVLSMEEPTTTTSALHSGIIETEPAVVEEKSGNVDVVDAKARQGGW